MLVEELKSRLDMLTNQHNNLKTEVSDLHNKIKFLGVRVHTLESNFSVTSSPVSFTNALHKFAEHDKCKFNVIVHGLPESSSSDINDKITDDKKSFFVILTELFITTPDKPIRFGRNVSSNSRPTKVLF